MHATKIMSKFYPFIIINILFLMTRLSFADFRFIVMADSRGSTNGVNVAELQTILSRIATLSPQPMFLLCPGDMINGSSNSYNTCTSQFRTWKNTVTAYYPATFFYPGVGNHETNSGASMSSETAFKDIFSEFTVGTELTGYNKTAYSFDYDNSRFIMLNSNHIGGGVNNKIDSTQRSWLYSQLTTGGETHYFVFAHDPAYPIGDHVGSALDAYPTDRDAFWQAIDTTNVSMVFVGHEHNYNRRLINNVLGSYTHGIFQVTTGTCGAPIATTATNTTNVNMGPLGVYHFAVVDVTGNSIQVYVYQDNGTLIDTFSTSTVPVSISHWETY